LSLKTVDFQKYTRSISIFLVESNVISPNQILDLPNDGKQSGTHPSSKTNQENQPKPKGAGR
jgi:hypothetical protein